MCYQLVASVGKWSFIPRETPGGHCREMLQKCPAQRVRELGGCLPPAISYWERAAPRTSSLPGFPTHPAHAEGRQTEKAPETESRVLAVGSQAGVSKHDKCQGETGGVLMATAIDPQVLTPSRGDGQERDKVELTFERDLGGWVGEMGRGGQSRSLCIPQRGKSKNKEIVCKWARILAVVRTQDPDRQLERQTGARLWRTCVLPHQLGISCKQGAIGGFHIGKFHQLRQRLSELPGPTPGNPHRDSTSRGRDQGHVRSRQC